MLPSYFNNAYRRLARSEYNWWAVVALPAWIYTSFTIAQLLVSGLVQALNTLQVPFMLIDQNVLTAALAAMIYLLTVGLAISLPWLVLHHRTSLKQVGLQRLPTWTDIWMVPAGLVVYLIMSALLILLAKSLFPGFDAGQAQNVGFGHLTQGYEYLLAFATLVIIAPAAEEILFRGYLFGKLRLFVPIWSAILVTSLLFGYMHGALNLALDTFCLSLVLCVLRTSTGSLWSSILLHMTKNGIAFYFLFINPALLGTLW